MRAFNVVYKEKLNESTQSHENKILIEFKTVYNALLEHYNLTAINDLNEESQISFLTELNQYWSEETGISELGKHFVKKRSLILTENSTPIQKKNYLKGKAFALLNETIRQNDLKFKLYSVIDEMYMQVKGDKLDDVLTTTSIYNIITEAFADSLDNFITDIKAEIDDSVQEKVEEKSKESINESTSKKIYFRKNK